MANDYEGFAEAREQFSLGHSWSVWVREQSASTMEDARSLVKGETLPEAPLTTTGTGAAFALRTEFAVIARSQESGRGRLGRRWESPPDAGLYMTLCLGSVDQQFFSALSLIVGLACQRLCRSLGLEAQLKWPNDVLVHSGSAGSPQKLAGILIERFEHEGRVFASIGIGLNIRSGEYLSAVAGTSLEDQGVRIERPELFWRLMHQVEQILDERHEEGTDDLLRQWERASFTVGKAVAPKDHPECTGWIARGVDGQGALIVYNPDRPTEEKTLLSGEVEVPYVTRS